MSFFKQKQRIKYYFNKKDEYSIHSPFMFDLYIKTIKENRKNPQKLIKKLEEEYGKDSIIQISCDYNVFQETHKQDTENKILIIENPYKNKDTYQDFKKIIHDPRTIVSIDFFKIALIFQNHKLSPQHYCL